MESQLMVILGVSEFEIVGMKLQVWGAELTAKSNMEPEQGSLTPIQMSESKHG